ncbi:MAG: hypothetical protein WKG07_09365 [Hymenobacter sp.]
MAGMGRDEEMIYVTELLSENKMPAPASITDATDWAGLLGRAA